jgi:methionyl-tRNA formyltransferase
MDLTNIEKFPDFPKIIFMGTPDFAVPALQALVASGHNLTAVVTQPDRRRGRGRKTSPSPVKKAALHHGLDVIQPENATDISFQEVIKAKDPDIFVVIAYGQILRKSLLELPRFGAINIHASLLPRFRGAAPIQWAILRNETVTGLTAMYMEEQLDAGPILYQEEVPILTHETAGRLHDRLSLKSGPFLLKTLQGLSENRLIAEPQDGSRASYAPKIGKDMALIRWNQKAKEVSALIRALDPWPGATTKAASQEIKLFAAETVEFSRSGFVPGRVVGLSEAGLLVEARDGIVRVGAMQKPGKKRLSAVDFFKGFPLESVAVLG